jgi:5-methylcytosine-specific restriction endonuclease McrA
VISFTQFRKLAAARGLHAIDHGGGHWQLQGGTCLVNYYPEGRKGPTIYVNGTRDADEQGPPERAIEIALDGPRLRGSTPPRGGCGKFQRARRRLLRKNPICMWCGARLTEETATLEHVIPRARGGADSRNNYALACEGCNHGRGHAMNGPEAVDAR